MAVSILVGIDDSPDGMAALDWACREAALRRVPLKIFHALPRPRASVSGSRHRATAWAAAWAAAERLVGAAAQRAGQIVPEMTTELASGAPSASLIKRSADAELLVLGAHGHAGFHGRPARSVSWRVAGNAECPVVLVRSEPPCHPAVIIVGIGSGPAHPALRAAFAEAELRGVPLRAVRTWRPLTALTPHGTAPIGSTVGRLRRREERRIIDVLAPWRQRYPQVKVEAALVSGSPRHVLVAASRSAVLLVVGAQHPAPFAQALGSVAHSAARRAECPLLIAR